MKSFFTSLSFIVCSILTANAQLQMVADIYPGVYSSSPAQLTPMGGKIYFNASKLDSLLPGTGNTENELWVSDGTAGGTQKVIDLLPGSSEGTLSPTGITRIGNKLFFVGHTNMDGSELWISDGTKNGTHIVKNLYPYGESAFSGGTASIIEYKGKAVFIARDNDGYGLFISDGTDAGTIKLISVGLGSGYANFAVLNDVLYVHTGDASNKYQLIKTDGTQAQTSVVFHTEAYFASNMVAMNDAIYFIGDLTGWNFELWKTDGTSSGTVLVKDIKPGSSGSNDAATPMMASNNTLYFFADDGTSGTELWKSDGSSSGTTLLKDFTPGSSGTTFNYGPILNINGKVVFGVQDPAGYPYNLWSSDGTSSGTIKVADTCMGAYLFGTNYCYTSSKILIADGNKIFETDGTLSGTQVIATKDYGTGSINQMTYTNNTIYCSVYDTASGEELWKMSYQGGVVGIKELIKPGDLKVYPNPCHDHFTIDITEKTPVILTVYDLTGKTVLQMEHPGKHMELNVGDWNRGCYIYHLQLNDGTIQTGKIALL